MNKDQEKKSKKGKKKTDKDQEDVAPAPAVEALPEPERPTPEQPQPEVLQAEPQPEAIQHAVENGTSAPPKDKSSDATSVESFTPLPDLSPEEIMLEFRTSSSYSSLDKLVVTDSKKAQKPVPEQGHVECIVKWSGSGRNVAIAFSDDWSTHHRGKRLGTGAFEFTHFLPAMKPAYFKFLVDGHWCLSNDYATIADSFGNVNNTLFPVLLEWPHPEASVTVSFLHEKGQGMLTTTDGNSILEYNTCPRHALRYSNKKWLFSHAFSITHDLRFMFVVRKSWESNENYPLTKDGDNIIEFPRDEPTAVPVIANGTNGEPASPQPSPTLPPQESPLTQPTPAPENHQPNHTQHDELEAPEPLNPSQGSPPHEPEPQQPEQTPEQQVPALPDHESERAEWDGLFPVTVAWKGAGEQVSIRGSFDSWQASHDLSRTASGVWTTTFRLPPMTLVTFKVNPTFAEQNSHEHG
eukprot:c9419_g1_i1.p1 GENE.c9419_g1_i1~~c9419_g1_i1.p1  ORF type:complete len:476 (+),score=77.58 c9419_g1_i1:34-1428(+)